MAGSALSTKISMSCGVSRPVRAISGSSRSRMSPTWVTRRAPWRSVTVGSNSAAGSRLISHTAYSTPSKLVLAPSWVSRPATTADHAPLPSANAKTPDSTTSRSRLISAVLRVARCGRIVVGLYATFACRRKECRPASRVAVVLKSIDDGGGAVSHRVGADPARTEPVRPGSAGYLSQAARSDAGCRNRADGHPAPLHGAAVARARGRLAQSTDRAADGRVRGSSGPRAGRPGAMVDHDQRAEHSGDENVPGGRLAAAATQ